MKVFTQDEDAGIPDRPATGPWFAVRRHVSESWRRYRLTSLLVAVPGLVLQFAGVGSRSSETSRMWHDLGLLFLAGAVTVPYWRRIERDYTGQVRWRDALHKVSRRTSAVLLYGAIAGLVTYRWLILHGDPSTAALVAHLAGLSLVPAFSLPVLEPLVWRCFPAALRQPDSRGLPRGPSVVREYAGGAPKKPRNRVETKQFAQLSRVVKWNGSSIVVREPGRSRIRVFPITGRPQAAAGDVRLWDGSHPGRTIAEMVLFQARSTQINGSLIFLDSAGNCQIIIDPYRFGLREAMRLAMLSGLPLCTYTVDSSAGNLDKIREQVFPHNPHCVTVKV